MVGEAGGIVYVTSLGSVGDFLGGGGEGGGGVTSARVGGG